MPGFRITESDLYDYDKGFLYRYNEHISKLTVCAKVRKPGYELVDDSRKFTHKGEAGNEEKLPENVRRAKSKVFELALCNEFSYFCTLTFSGEKVKDRYDLDGCMKRLSKWLNNYNSRRAGAAVRYLLIPEPHKDGAWHLHGLITGIPKDDLRQFQPDERLPNHIRKELSQGHQVLQWVTYDAQFGYCTLSPIRSVDAVSKYITKYVTKELGNAVKELNAHLYYRSQGLKQKELVYAAPDCVLPDPDYTGTYSKIKNATSPEELLPYFTLKEKEAIYDTSRMDTPMDGEL